MNEKIKKSEAVEELTDENLEEVNGGRKLELERMVIISDGKCGKCGKAAPLKNGYCSECHKKAGLGGF